MKPIMSNMMSAITPKSDQLNADDLPAGTSKTILITRVNIKPGEQPVSINYEGDNGKPYKPCKSMCRVLVNCWGADANEYVGRSITLYCDPSVRWGGMEVGGIRISHLSHIETKIVIALTVTRGKRAPFAVEPLPDQPSATSKPASDPKPKADALPDDGELPSDELLEELGGRFMECSWSDDKQDSLMLKLSEARVKRNQTAVTQWGQATRGQIRWAISQVK